MMQAVLSAEAVVVPGAVMALHNALLAIPYTDTPNELERLRQCARLLAKLNELGYDVVRR